MPRVITIAVVVGIVAGLLVGVFHYVFTVPVIERAIALEEERTAAEAKAKGMEEEKPLVSLGVQAAFTIIGFGLLGIVVGLIVAAGFTLLHWVVPEWPPISLAMVIGPLGFWMLSLFPFIKYPLVPPGAGEQSTLLFRQGFQILFFVLSTVGVVGLLLGLRRIKTLATPVSQQRWLYGLAVLAYGGFAAVIFLALPGNPDPVSVPVDLLALFRALAMISHFLFWILTAAGVALAITWYERAAQRGQGRGSPRDVARGMPATR